jgi:ABC-type dipeptide/oligopeptide/nickel transport system ATPase component
MRIEVKPTYILVIIGKRGSGKTILIHYLVREAEFKNTVVYDGNLGVDHDRARDYNNSENITVVKRRFTDPAWENFNKPELHKGKYVVIDEMDMVNHHHYGFYVEWVNTGRHWPSGGIVSARRPTRLPRDVTANADLTFIFKARERSVQSFLKDSYTDEVAVEAATLKQYEFLIVDANQDLIARAKLTPDGKRMEVLQEYSSSEAPDNESWSADDRVSRSSERKNRDS